MRSTGLHRFAASLCTLAACVRQEPAPLPPHDGRHTLILVAVSGDASTAAVAALDRQAALPLVIDRAKQSDLYALLYQADVTELGLAEGPLEIQNDCGRELPAGAAVYSAEIAQGTLSAWSAATSTPARIADLRVAAGEVPCPETIDPLRRHLVDVRCTGPSGAPIPAPADCEPRVRQEGCALTIDTGACFLGQVVGRTYAPSGLCFPPRSQGSVGRCRSIRGPKDSVAAADCAAGDGSLCELYVYEDVPSTRFAADGVALFGAVMPPPDPSFQRPPVGYIGGIAVLDDRVVAATFDGRAERWLCDNRAASRVFFIDPGTLAVTGSATAPPCLTQIVRTPAGDGFFGAYGGSTPEIGRFRRDGRLLAHGALPLPPHDPSVAYFAESIAVGGDPPRTVAVDLESTFLKPAVSLVFGFDLMLGPRAFQPMYHPLIELSPFDAGHFAALDDLSHGAALVDVDSGIASPGAQLLDVQIKSGYLGQVLRHAASGRTLVSITGGSGGVYAFNAQDHFLGRAGDFGKATDAWAMVTWPKDPSLVLVGISGSQGARTASVALMDPAQPRFLPDSANIGVGPPGRMVADGEGRVWVPLPWSGRVVRVSPR